MMVMILNLMVASIANILALLNALIAKKEFVWIHAYQDFILLIIPVQQYVEILSEQVMNNVRIIILKNLMDVISAYFHVL